MDAPCGFDNAVQRIVSAGAFFDTQALTVQPQEK